eukprot:365344-Chlamydomonas_euryale.AAC.9
MCGVFGKGGAARQAGRRLYDWMVKRGVPSLSLSLAGCDKGNGTYALQCCQPYSALGPLTAAPRQAVRRSNYYLVCVADRSY